MLAEALSDAAPAGAGGDLLRERRRRGRRRRDEVRARGDRPSAAPLVSRAASTASRWAPSRSSATSSSRRGSGRCCPAARPSRSVTSRRSSASSRRATSPPSSSSRSRAGWSRCRPRATCSRPRSCAAATGRCSSSTRSRPASGAPDAGSRLERWGLEPDFVLVGKALSGGYMPTAAMVTTRETFQRTVGTLERCYVHQSTFGRNRLSMAAGLATLRVIERVGGAGERGDGRRGATRRLARSSSPATRSSRRSGAKG